MSGRNIRQFAAILTVAVLATACSKSSPTGPSGSGGNGGAPTVASIAVAGSNAIDVSATTQLTATATLSDGTTRNVTSTAVWQSSNPAVATVTAGRVLAVSAGTATISAASDGRTGQLGVTARAVDDLQRVTVRVTNIVIDGTCDTNSIFEDSKDGEFEFEFTVTPSGQSRTTILTSGPRAFTLGAHTFTQATSFTRNVTQGQDFLLQFVGSEFDGILGADPRLNGFSRNRPYLYTGGQWAPGSRSLSIGSGSCGATINFTITSSAL